MKPPMIVIAAGGLLLLISLAVLVVSVMLPIVNGPRTSWEEAMWGILPGACCSFTSLGIVVGGIIWWALSRRAPP
jgi:hypothetical protein